MVWIVEVATFEVLTKTCCACCSSTIDGDISEVLQDDDDDDEPELDDEELEATPFGVVEMLLLLLMAFEWLAGIWNN